MFSSESIPILWLIYEPSAWCRRAFINKFTVSSAAGDKLHCGYDGDLMMIFGTVYVAPEETYPLALNQ